MCHGTFVNDHVPAEQKNPKTNKFYLHKSIEKSCIFINSSWNSFACQQLYVYSVIFQGSNIIFPFYCARLILTIGGKEKKFPW